MPITSTKNFRLSSGFGVSNSMWPRWARSKIGSGCIRISPASGVGWAKRSVLNQGPRHVVEQFIDRKGARDQSLLRGKVDDHFQRAAHLIRVETRCGRRSAGGLREQAMNLPDDLGMLIGQRLTYHHHMVDRHHTMPGKPHI